MAETPPIKKYMFDKSFDHTVAPPKKNVVPERKPVLMKPEEIDALRQEGFDAGFSAGQKILEDEQAKQLLSVVSSLEGRIIKLLEDAHSSHREREVELRRAVMAVSRKILPDFTAKYGVSEIEPLISGAITDMMREPRLVVRIHETQFDVIQERISEITVQKAYVGKVVVLADPGIAPGDCRIEWADGGIERNTEATWKHVEKAVAPDQTLNQPSED